MTLSENVMVPQHVVTLADMPQIIMPRFRSSWLYLNICTFYYYFIGIYLDYKLINIKNLTFIDYAYVTRIQ